MKLSILFVIILFLFQFSACSNKTDADKDDVTAKIATQIESAVSNQQLMDTNIVKYSFFTKAKNISEIVKKYNTAADSFQTFLSRIPNSKYDSLRFAFMDYLKVKGKIVSIFTSIQNLSAKMNGHSSSYVDNWNEAHVTSSMSEKIKYEAKLDNIVQQAQNDAGKILADIKEYQDGLSKIKTYQTLVKRQIVALGMNKNLTKSFEFTPDNQQILNKIKNDMEYRKRYWASNLYQP